MGSGLLEDVFHVYHFFRGDVGWGRFAKQKEKVAPFTLEQWLQCIQQILRGTTKKTRMLPPLMSHLFVVALQHLVPRQLLVALTPASWSEVLMLYMDAMERYFTTEASGHANALPGLAIDAEYLVGATEEPKDEALLEPPMTTTRTSFYLQGPLFKAHSKLLTQDPWMLTAEELVGLLRALSDDMLATLPECSYELDDRLQETHELLKRKKAADALIRKLQTTKNKEQAEEKEQQESDEKQTRSNTKLPTVSDNQMESAKRAQHKANHDYEKACRSRLVRTEHIGEDRNFHAFHHFYNDPEKVYVLRRGKNMPSPASFKVPDLEAPYKTTWYSMDKKSILESYIKALDVRGKREAALSEVLQPARKFLFDDIKVLNDKKALLKEKLDLQRRFENAKLNSESGRKSGRLAAQSEQEFTSLQTEIDFLEGCIVTGEAAPPKPDLEVETGLQLLRDFDQQESQNQRRRATRRDVQKQLQEEEKNDNPLPRLQCSRLWSSGNIDGTGIVGSIVWELLELEERVERLASWDENGEDRKAWISTLETAAHSWHAASPPLLLEDIGEDVGSVAASPEDESKAKKLRMSGTPDSVVTGSASSTLTASQILSMLKVRTLSLVG
jgi:hypothetical protein